MEQTRSWKITIEQETNKDTYRSQYDSPEAALQALKVICGETEEGSEAGWFHTSHEEGEKAKTAMLEKLRRRKVHLLRCYEFWLDEYCNSGDDFAHGMKNQTQAALGTVSEQLRLAEAPGTIVMPHP